MKVFKHHATAEIPSFATEGSACFDLKVSLLEDTRVRSFNPHQREMEIPVKMASNGKLSVQLQPQFRTLIPTGLIFDIPEKQVLKLFIRSSMALKNGLFMANGTAIIDSDYVDPVYMMIYNASDTPVVVYDGDRLAQGMLQKLLNYSLSETTTKPSPKSDRTGGLGSTGV